MIPVGITRSERVDINSGYIFKTFSKEQSSINLPSLGYCHKNMYHTVPLLLLAWDAHQRAMEKEETTNQYFIVFSTNFRKMWYIKIDDKTKKVVK